MSLVNFQVTLDGEINDIDRKMLVKIADIIEQGIVDMEERNMEHNLDYQELLNFVMDINSKYKKYMLVKVSDKVQAPHISVIKDYMKRKQEKLKAKLT